jgi:hypothetical protein
MVQTRRGSWSTDAERAASSWRFTARLAAHVAPIANRRCGPDSWWMDQDVVLISIQAAV